MAISKKEQAAIDAKINELETRCALRFTDGECVPDIIPKSSDGCIVHGFEPYGGSGIGTHFVATDGLISRSAWDKTKWPNMLDKDGSGSRDIPKLYSTRELALRALRKRLEREFGEKLLLVDKMIEAEIANPTPRPENIKTR